MLVTRRDLREISVTSAVIWNDINELIDSWEYLRDRLTGLELLDLDRCMDRVVQSRIHSLLTVFNERVNPMILSDEEADIMSEEEEEEEEVVEIPISSYVIEDSLDGTTSVRDRLMTLRNRR